jgi:hypothetical protein
MALCLSGLEQCALSVAALRERTHAAIKALFNNQQRIAMMHRGVGSPPDTWDFVDVEALLFRPPPPLDDHNDRDTD